MTPLRLGFIGGGINSAVGRAHYAACRMDGKFEIVAGCFSRDDAVNAATGEAFNCRPYTSAGSMMNVHKLDAVVVLTPTPDHNASVMFALEMGIPVICEKALAATSAQAEELCRLREENNGFLAVTYNYTGYPMARELRDMILGKEFGKI